MVFFYFNIYIYIEENNLKHPACPGFFPICTVQMKKDLMFNDTLRDKIYRIAFLEGHGAKGRTFVQALKKKKVCEGIYL